MQIFVTRSFITRQHKFSPTIDIRLLTLNETLPEYVSQNNMTLGELFVGFLQYYAQTFEWVYKIFCFKHFNKLYCMMT